MMTFMSPPRTSTNLHRPPPPSPSPPALDAPAVDHLAAAHHLVLVVVRHGEAGMVRLDLDAGAYGVPSLERFRGAAHDAVLLRERGDREVGMTPDGPERRSEVEVRGARVLGERQRARIHDEMSPPGAPPRLVRDDARQHGHADVLRG